MAKLIELFGPPPLLRNESIDKFKEAFTGLYKAMDPEDFHVESLVYDLAIETCRVHRLRRHEKELLEKWEQMRCEHLARREHSKAMNVGDARIREKYEACLDDDSDYRRETEKLSIRESKILFEKLRATPTDLDYVLASLIERVERYEFRVNRAIRRRDDVIRQIGWYKLALSKKARKVSNAFIEAAITHVETSSAEVSLIPPRGSDDPE